MVGLRRLLNYVLVAAISVTGVLLISIVRIGRVADPGAPASQTALLSGLEPEARYSFPDFDLHLLTGGSVTDSAFSGRLTVVNVWASWCGPCRVELPLLVALADSLGQDSPLQLITFNEDVDPAAAARFLREVGIEDLPVALGGGNLKRAWRYWGLPQTTLVDGAGRVVYSWNGFGGDAQMDLLGAIIEAESNR